ncbi:MAG: sulfurtransferase [Candidatus Latescibacterota bacterium]|nr:MAG: sulfurtransferase [Candidatus Latescibacterota bacterium]
MDRTGNVITGKALCYSNRLGLRTSGRILKHVLVVFVVAFLANSGYAAEPRSDILVTPDWLAEHLDDESLVVVQLADVELDYMRGHIPGARFLWPGWLEKSSPDKSVELYPVARMDSVLESLGISDSSQIVLCHTYTTLSAACVARAWVMFDYLGMGDRTKILDGGFEAWNAMGMPVTKEVPKHTPGTFTPKIKEDVFVDLEYVKARVGEQGIRLVDTRRSVDYRGHVRGVVRAGHIPGAVHLPYATIIDKTRRYAPVDTLGVRFAKAGIKPGDEIISYCYKGRSACFAYIAGRMLGYDVHVYDGSSEEWCGREDLPVEVSEVEQR